MLMTENVPRISCNLQVTPVSEDINIVYSQNEHHAQKCCMSGKSLSIAPLILLFPKMTDFYRDTAMRKPKIIGTVTYFHF